MNVWRLIETAPKDQYNLALGWFPARGPWRDRVKEINTAGLNGYGDNGPTHWMPFPDPPE